MSAPLDLRVSGPFALGDVIAEVEVGDRDQPVEIRLTNGAFAGDLQARPRRVRLTVRSADATGAALVPTFGETVDVPEGTPVSVETLFEDGVAIPEDGRLRLQIAWGTPCHSHVHDHGASLSKTRFGSWEHFMCAALVGKDGDGRSALRLNATTAHFDAATPLPIGKETHTFGEIIALGGDFYAHLDETAAADYAWAWPAMAGVTGWIAGDYRGVTLAGDTEPARQAILGIIQRDKDVDRGAAGEFAALALDAARQDYPARRYLALASQNYCHFGSQPADGRVDDGTNDALRLYRAYHARAVALGTAARSAADIDAALSRALAVDAFGCHFLTDLFASGHIRVPRRLLGERYGIFRGSLRMSHAMHAEDNGLGLWCRQRVNPAGKARVVWRAYGDGKLRDPAAELHLAQVREAVRRSAAEVFAASCSFDLPVEERAEAMLPVPLAAGSGPRFDDVLPNGLAVPAGGAPNHVPLYARSDDGRLLERAGSPELGRLVRFVD